MRTKLNIRKLRGERFIGGGIAFDKNTVFQIGRGYYQQKLSIILGFYCLGLEIRLGKFKHNG